MDKRPRWSGVSIYERSLAGLLFYFGAGLAFGAWRRRLATICVDASWRQLAVKRRAVASPIEMLMLPRRYMPSSSRLRADHTA